MSEAGQLAQDRWHYTAGSQHVGCICCCVDGKHAARFHATADDLNDSLALEARIRELTDERDQWKETALELRDKHGI